MNSVVLPAAGKLPKSSYALAAVLIWANAFVLFRNLGALFGAHPLSSNLVLAALFPPALLLFSPTTIVALYPQERRAVAKKTFFNRWVRSRTLDLSKCAWVRARGSRGKAIKWVTVEAGTPGYQTVRLMSFAPRDGQEIDEASQWCSRIAEALAIEDKGYREVW